MKGGLLVRLGAAEATFLPFTFYFLTVSESNVRHWHARRGRLGETRPASAFGCCEGHVFGTCGLFVSLV